MEGVYTFLKGISLKVNVIVWHKFKLFNYNVTVQHVSHYTTATPSWTLILFSLSSQHQKKNYCYNQNFYTTSGYEIINIGNSSRLTCPVVLGISVGLLDTPHRTVNWERREKKKRKYNQLLKDEKFCVFLKKKKKHWDKFYFI